MRLDETAFSQEMLYLKEKLEHMSYISDDKNSKGTHRVSLFIERNRAIYFNYFEIKYTSQEI